MNEKFSQANSDKEQTGEVLGAAADTETGHEQEAQAEPQIYVACLAAYSRGDLHGVWLDVAREPEAIYEDIHDMLADSPAPDAEEFAIHDSQDFGSCTIHEHDS